MEEFTPEVTAKVEELVKQIDAVRARSDLSEEQQAAEIKKIEQAIHTVREGRIGVHSGEGHLTLPPPSAGKVDR